MHFDYFIAKRKWNEIDVDAFLFGNTLHSINIIFRHMKCYGFIALQMSDRIFNVSFQ